MKQLISILLLSVSTSFADSLTVDQVKQIENMCNTSSNIGVVEDTCADAATIAILMGTKDAEDFCESAHPDSHLSHSRQALRLMTQGLKTDVDVNVLSGDENRTIGKAQQTLANNIVIKQKQQSACQKGIFVGQAVLK